MSLHWRFKAYPRDCIVHFPPLFRSASRAPERVSDLQKVTLGRIAWFPLLSQCSALSAQTRAQTNAFAATWPLGPETELAGALITAGWPVNTLLTLLRALSPCHAPSCLYGSPSGSTNSRINGWTLGSSRAQTADM